MYEGVEKFRHGHEIDSPAWAFGVLTFSIFLETYSFRTAVVAARPLKGDRTWRQFVRKTKRAELAVVLLEDRGAMVGLVVALAGVSLAVATGESRWDAVGHVDHRRSSRRHRHHPCDRDEALEPDLIRATDSA